MALYYFDLKDGERQRDHDGIRLATDAEAIAHAENIARKLSSIKDPASPQRFISVVHESGREVKKVFIPT